jgi:hypothetical protein
MTPDLRKKALAVLREGRLQLLHVTCRRTAHDVDEVIARVRSSRDGGPAYAVDFLDGAWTCTCRDGGGCAHVAAAQLVTGDASAVDA